MDGVDTLVRVEYVISWVEEMERKMKIHRRDLNQEQLLSIVSAYVKAQLTKR